MLLPLNYYLKFNVCFLIFIDYKHTNSPMRVNLIEPMDLHHWEQGLLGGYQTKQQALYFLSTCLPLPCYFIFSILLRAIIILIGFEPHQQIQILLLYP